MPERYAIYLPDGKKLSLPMALKTRRSLESARSWLYGKHQLEKPPVPWEQLRIVDLTKEEPPMDEDIRDIKKRAGITEQGEDHELLRQLADVITRFVLGDQQQAIQQFQKISGKPLLDFQYLGDDPQMYNRAYQKVFDNLLQALEASRKPTM